MLSTQRRLHQGDIFTSSEHLLAPLRQKNIVRMHRFCLASRRVRSRRHIGRCLRGGSGGDEDGENQMDTLVLTM
jgi:hypothetical protein